MKTTNYLAKFKNNNTSQCGEDGVIEEILRMLNIKKGSVLDIGASDGKWYSNTFTLLQKGFDVYAIEGSNNAKKMIKLKEEYPNLYPRQARIELYEDFTTNINYIIDEMDVPDELEFMSLDIDSIDPWVIKDIDRTPKFFVVEIEPRCYPLDDIWHDPKGTRETNFPQNLTGFGPMYKIAKEKGYRFIAQTSQNLFFLRNDLVDTIDCPEITSVHELSNFDARYIRGEKLRRWQEYNP